VWEKRSRAALVPPQTGDDEMPFNYDYGCDDEYELDADEAYDALAEEQYLAEMEGAFGPYVEPTL
jgi:hypothetical protein